MKTLKDKVIIITGAGGATAGAIIEAFHKAGARLLLVDRDALRIEGRASSYGLTPCQEDLLSFESAQRVVKEAKTQFSKVDGLVHLVGDVLTGSVLDTTFEDYTRVFQTNVRTLFDMTKAILPELVKRNEAFIAGIASREAWRGSAAGSSIFAAAKSAVATFLRSLDGELHQTGVGVSIIYPMGFIDTLHNRKTLGRSKEHTFIHPESIAQALIDAALSGQGGRLLEMPVYPPRDKKK
jgi:NADP-dependent 3-hydroxy acid dehydrogenase YdfG